MIFDDFIVKKGRNQYAKAIADKEIYPGELLEWAAPNKVTPFVHKASPGMQPLLIACERRLSGDCTCPLGEQDAIHEALKPYEPGDELRVYLPTWHDEVEVWINEGRKLRVGDPVVPAWDTDGHAMKGEPYPYPAMQLRFCHFGVRKGSHLVCINGRRGERMVCDVAMNWEFEDV